MTKEVVGRVSRTVSVECPTCKKINTYSVDETMSIDVLDICKHFKCFKEGEPAIAVFEQPKDLYLKTHATLKEEINDAGETTSFIEGEYSLDGDGWIECIIVWSEE